MVFTGCENSSNHYHFDDQEKLGKTLAQQQLDAYNDRDIDAFMKCYCDSVKVYGFPNDLIMNGWLEMKNRYEQMFLETPDLHCLLLNRMVQGNTVIDQELVTRKKESQLPMPLQSIKCQIIAFKKSISSENSCFQIS